MITAVAAGAGHPVVAGLLGLGSAGLAAGVVAMTWSVHTRQIRLAEVLARRQFMAAPAPAPVPPAEPAPGDEEAEGRTAGNGQATSIQTFNFDSRQRSRSSFSGSVRNRFPFHERGGERLGRHSVGDELAIENAARAFRSTPSPGTK